MQSVADLLESFHLYAVCVDCTRMERVRIQELIDRFGSELTIDDLRRRLRCASCGQRTGDIRIVYVGKQARVAGFHYGGSGYGRHDAQSASSSVDSRVIPNPSTPT